jgi:hypothetical protein
MSIRNLLCETVSAPGNFDRLNYAGDLSRAGAPGFSYSRRSLANAGTNQYFELKLALHFQPQTHGLPVTHPRTVPGEPAMNKLFRSLCIVIVLFAVTAFAQVPNGGFETWANGSPTGWAINNAPPVYITVTQSTTARSGSSAARGEVVTVAGVITMSPFIQSGTGGKGFPYTQKPTAVTGYYQLFPAAGSADQLLVNVLMTKGGNMQTAVAAGAQGFGASLSYKQFTVPLLYATGETPDTCYIQVSIVNSATGTPKAGSYFIVDDITFSTSPTGVVPDDGEFPKGFALEQNYPNPFNPSTAMSYRLVANSFVTLEVYDVLGQSIATLVNETQAAGPHTVRWDAAGRPSGVYYYRIQTGAFNETKRMLLLR